MKHLRGVYFGWWIVSAAVLLNFLSGGIYYFGFSAFLKSLSKDFGVGYGVVSLAFGLSGVVQGVGLGPVMGIVIDRVGPRKVMLAGVTVLGLGFVLLAASPNIPVFYLVFLLLVAPGISLGTQTPVTTAVANWFVRRRGMAFGIVNVGFGASTLLVLLTTFLIDSWGWRTAAIAIGVILWAVGYPLALLMRHRPEEYGLLPDGNRERRPLPATANPGALSGPSLRGKEAPSRAQGAAVEQDFTLGEALRTRAFWFLFLGFSLRSGVAAGTSFHLLPSVQDKGFSAATAAQMVAFFGVASIPFRLLSGYLVDRYEKRMVAAGMVAFAGLAVLGFIWAESLWAITLCTAVFAIGSGGTAGLAQPIAGGYFGRKHYASIVGFGSMVTVAGQSSFPIMAGFVRDASGSYAVAFYIFAVVSALSVVVLLLAKQPVKRARAAGG